MLKLKAALMAGSILGATAAMAQTALPITSESGGAAPVEGIAPAVPPSDAASEIIVTGIRGSLATSARIKRDANQIVDSITATDVGKFPDTNIAESLQRITGVAIDRSGGEGQFITVRGLGPQFNTVLVNGRVMATDNPGREFSFDVLSSNMIQRTDVYKSPQAELQEGGIGATVNIVTARPLEGKSGLHGALSSGGIYDTLRGKVSPDLSGIASWANEDKTIGLTLSGSYTVRKSQIDDVDIGGWIYGQQGVINGGPNSSGLDPSAFSKTDNINTPQNLQFMRELDKRKRINFSGAFQWKPTDRLEVTLDGVYSKFDVYTNHHTFANFYSARFIGLVTDGTGTVTGFNRPGSQFLAANPGLTDPALGDQRVTLSQNDNIISNSNRLTQSYQIGANTKWTPIDDLEIRVDASKTLATQHNPNEFVVVGSLAQTAPQFNLNSGELLPTASNYGNITDPSLMRAHFTQVGYTKVRDAGQEYHLDTTKRFQDSILRSIQVGGEYSQRHKVQRSWNNEDGQCAYCGYDIPIPTNLLSAYNLDHFLSGVSGSANAPKSWIDFDPAKIIAFLSDPATLALPRQGHTAAEQAAEAARLLALPGGPYGLREKLGNLLDVRERVWAGYASVSFGGDRWSGNAGVRVVHTSTLSRGYDVPVIAPPVTTPGDDTLNYTYGPATAIAVKNDYTNVLPSVNVKYNLSSNLVTRAAFSQMVTRPTLTDLGVNNSFGGRVAVPQSSGGNPDLKPFKSTNYDLSLEWYPSRVSYFSVGAFYKDLSSFLELQTLPVQRFGLTYQDTRTRNGQSGYIRGVEIGGQYAFDFLHGWMSGFGVTGNYTYVDSKVKRDAELADYTCGYDGLSPHSANGSIFYEKYGIEARASYNWRSDYLRACRSDQGRPRNRSAYGQFDFNLAFDVRPNIQVYVQGVNVLDAHVHEWSAIEERFLLLQDTGSRYNFGVRMKF